MIDINKEKLISLSNAAEQLPARRNGKKPHPSTLYRWATNGLRGVTLEVLRVGSTTCTSLPALQRFLTKLTELELMHEKLDFLKSLDTRPS